MCACVFEQLLSFRSFKFVPRELYVHSGLRRLFPRIGTFSCFMSLTVPPVCTRFVSLLL